MQGDSRMSGIPSGQEIDWDTSNLEGSGGLDAAMQSGPAAASRREIVHKDAGGRSQYSPIRIAVKGPDNRLSMSTLVVTPFPRAIGIGQDIEGRRSCRAVAGGVDVRERKLRCT